MHFAKDGVAKVMPTDTKYIAILRDPADLFYSIFSHYYKDQGSRAPESEVKFKVNGLGQGERSLGLQMSNFKSCPWNPDEDVNSFQRAPGDKRPKQVRAFLDEPNKYYGK